MRFEKIYLKRPTWKARFRSVQPNDSDKRPHTDSWIFPSQSARPFRVYPELFLLIFSTKKNVYLENFHWYIFQFDLWSRESIPDDASLMDVESEIQKF